MDEARLGEMVVKVWEETQECEEVEEREISWRERERERERDGSERAWGCSI